MSEVENLISVILLVIISPLGLYLKKKQLDQEFLINLILYLISFSVLGTAHAFYVLGVDILYIILNILISPLSVYL